MTSVFSVFTACGSLSIIDVYKEKHVPGLANLNNYVVYTVLFETEEDFTLNTISLYQGNVELPVASYAVIDLKDMSGFTVVANDQLFTKGNYKITFRIDSDANFMEKQNMSFKYTQKDRAKSKKESITRKETVITNR